MFFTDKMPENCMNCPCADGEYGVCNIDYSVGLSADDRPKECPLQEVKHAHWEKVADHVFRCSLCNNHRRYASNYCPNCGAKMDEEEKQQ